MRCAAELRFRLRAAVPLDHVAGLRRDGGGKKQSPFGET
jgi:hypothetical protein